MKNSVKERKRKKKKKRVNEGEKKKDGERGEYTLFINYLYIYTLIFNV